MTTIRRYRVGDGPATFDVFYNAVHVGAAGHYSELDRGAWAAAGTMPPAWDARFMAQNCQVAEIAGRIVGFMSLTDTGHIDMAFVLPEQMGTGLAGKLYAELETAARAAGLTHLTTDASHLAMPFFKRLEWKVVASKTSRQNGRDIDNFAMKKQI